MKLSIYFSFISLFLLNCISYYQYDKKLLEEATVSNGERLRINRLYNKISLRKGSDTGPCADILEDAIVDDSSSEFSVNVLVGYKLENPGNPFLALIHFSASLSTAGIIPYQQKFICNYQIQVFKKDKIILSQSDRYTDRNIFTLFFIFLLPIRDEEQGLDAIDNFKKNNIYLIRKAVLNEK